MHFDPIGIMLYAGDIGIQDNPPFLLFNFFLEEVAQILGAFLQFLVLQSVLNIAEAVEPEILVHIPQEE